MTKRDEGLRKEQANATTVRSEARTQSHTRFKPPSQRVDRELVDGETEPRSQGPSTLPPAPFAHEGDVHGHEWWLDAHMDLASNLLCLEQSLDAHDEGTKCAALASRVADVRDALYELYCDAADARMEEATAPCTPLTIAIEALYAFCHRVVDVVIVGRSRSAGRADAALELAAAKPLARENELLFDDAAQRAIRGAIAALGIDFASPVEPLRNLPKDVEQMFVAAKALRDELAR